MKLHFYSKQGYQDDERGTNMDWNEVVECPWYKDGMCVFDVEESECIEEFTTEKCNANPDNIEYTPMEMEQPDFCR